MEQQPARLRSYVAPRLPADNGSDAIALARAAALLQRSRWLAAFARRPTRSLSFPRFICIVASGDQTHAHDGGGVRSDVRHCPIRRIYPRNDDFVPAETSYMQDFGEADAGTRTPGPLHCE
jgi:hypothetical protein